MGKKRKANNLALCLFAAPIAGWVLTAKYDNLVNFQNHTVLKDLIDLVPHTLEYYPLVINPVLSFCSVLGIWQCYKTIRKKDFSGADYDEYLRGAQIVSSKKLAKITKEKQQQIRVGDIPMPTDIENLMTLLVGSTGTGKSVALRRMVFDFLKRRDKAIIVDNNGDLYSKFGSENDIVLNAYDVRSPGWSFYNEIKNDFDFDTMAKAIIPISTNNQTEEWNGYARILLSSIAKRLYAMNDTSINALIHLATIEAPDELAIFLEGTPAQSLFVSGAERALGSARFVCGKYLKSHIAMKDGNFSIRKWLFDEEAGNLYITWREDMVEAMRPLISCWMETFYVYLLSSGASFTRKIWSVIDELDSMERLQSFNSALTKGRKSGLRVIAGLQSVSQLTKNYGQEDAKVLKACFRNLIVFACSVTDPETAKEMSNGFGTHDVIRDKESVTSGLKNASMSNSDDVVKDEPIILPSELIALPERTGYVKFAGDYPIAKVYCELDDFEKINIPIIAAGDVDAVLAEQGF